MSKVTRKQQKNLIHSIASQRMWRLFQLAEEEFPEHPERSARYVQLIRNISMRNRMSIPREIKRRICRHCYSFLVPGNNARYRLKGGYIVISCKHCGKESRYPYKIPKRKEMNSKIAVCKQEKKIADCKQEKKIAECEQENKGNRKEVHINIEPSH